MWAADFRVFEIRALRLRVGFGSRVSGSYGLGRAEGFAGFGDLEGFNVYIVGFRVT